MREDNEITLLQLLKQSQFLKFLFWNICVHFVLNIQSEQNLGGILIGKKLQKRDNHWNSTQSACGGIKSHTVSTQLYKVRGVRGCMTRAIFFWRSPNGEHIEPGQGEKV